MATSATPLADVTRLDDLIGAFLQYLDGQIAAGKNKPNTRIYYEGQLKPWADQAAVGGRLGATSLDKLRAFHLTGRGGAKRPRIQAVQRLFNWANDQDLVEGNPFTKVKLPALGQRKRTLERLEIAVLLQASSRPLRWLLLFGLHTICRPGEIRGVRWSNYVERGTSQHFLLEEFKAQDRRDDQSARRVIPVNGYLARILRRWRLRRAPAPDDVIFLNSQRRPWTKDAVVQAVDTARRRAWIVTVRAPEGDEVKLGVVAGSEAQARAKAVDQGRGEIVSARNLKSGRERVVAYTLRHTRATAAIAGGANLVELSVAMGHSTTRMTERYVHPDAEKLGHVVEKAAGKKR